MFIFFLFIIKKKLFKKYIDNIMFATTNDDKLKQTYDTFFNTYPNIDEFVGNLVKTNNDQYMNYSKNT